MVKKIAAEKWRRMAAYNGGLTVRAGTQEPPEH